MAPKWIELVTGSLEQKKEWRSHQRRLDGIPEPHRSAAKAVQRYLLYYAGITDGQTSVTMIGDLVDLWDRAATDGTPVRDIVGDDPIDFAETFARAYTGAHWIDKERARLNTAIADAEGGAS